MRLLKQIIKYIFKPRNGHEALEKIHRLTPRPLIMKYIDFEAAKSEGYEEIGTVYFDYMDEPYTQENSAIYQAGRHFHIPENLVIEFLDIRFCNNLPNPAFSTVLARKIS